MYYKNNLNSFFYSYMLSFALYKGNFTVAENLHLEYLRIGCVPVFIISQERLYVYLRVYSKIIEATQYR